MKKLLSNICLVTLLIVGFTGQSWAFAGRHHHGGQNNGSQGGSSSPSGNNFPTDGNGPGGNGPGGNGPGGNGPGGNGPGGNGPGGNNFPSAPVPEPMTLSLLGTGLAGILLKRKIR